MMAGYWFSHLYVLLPFLSLAPSLSLSLSLLLSLSCSLTCSLSPSVVLNSLISLCLPLIIITVSTNQRSGCMRGHVLYDVSVFCLYFSTFVVYF